ncbi:MAG: ABC transporter permease, partial [Chitinophagales bacterium]
LAVFGLMVITLFSFIACFGYVIAPDNTPDANEQFSVLAMQKPGFSIQMMKLRKEKEDSTSFVKSIFLGKEKDYQSIPIVSLEKSTSNVFQVKEYKGKGFPAVQYEIESATLFDENIKTKTFLLGTDNHGRDIFSRLIIGARVSLLVGLVAVIISTFLGVVIGSVAGFFRGWVDKIVMWKMSVFWAIPTLLLSMALYISLKDFFDSAYIIIFIAIGCTMWVSMARIVRGQIFSIREIQFVEAADSMGFSSFRTIFRHILPNIIGPVIVVAAANFANAILIEAGLSFLGLGVQPPTPSWGGMLSEFKDFVGTDLSYLAFFPGALIMLLVLSFNLVGNGIRDAIDVKNI